VITEEKIQDVKKQLRSGVPEGEIKNELRKEGYAEEEIKKIFAPHKYDMSSWYWVFGIGFILGGIYLLVRDSEYWLHVLLTGLGLIIVNLNQERKRKKKIISVSHFLYVFLHPSHSSFQNFFPMPQLSQHRSD
jgi:hypothetical protein